MRGWSRLSWSRLSWIGLAKQGSGVPCSWTGSLCKRPKILPKKLNFENFKGSDGWLAGFKSCHDIKLQRSKSESGSADLEGVERGLTAHTVVGQMINKLSWTSITWRRQACTIMPSPAKFLQPVSSAFAATG